MIANQPGRSCEKASLEENIGRRNRTLGKEREAIGKFAETARERWEKVDEIVNHGEVRIRDSRAHRKCISPWLLGRLTERIAEKQSGPGDLD
jgi:hypothetical protein